MNELQNETFETLGVAPFFIERLLQRGISSPTPIQSLVIPRLLQAENLIFSSATGTGKTFAYLLPILQQYQQSIEGTCILIVAPTFELCSQIKRELDWVLEARTSAPKTSLLVGSGNMSRQIDALKKERPCIIVGNPGRIVQLLRMKKLKIAMLRCLVLDEGDRLIHDDTFAETQELLELLPPQRLTVACSATMHPKSRERLLPFMGQAVGFVDASQMIIRDRIEHWAIFSEERRKIDTLRSLLASMQPHKALVFTARNAQVGNIVSQLQHHKVNVDGLFGSMDKQKRKQAMDRFRNGKLHVLVSSDLLARGLDILDVNLIVTLDVPADSEVYLHRAGRTARAGKQGIMASIGDEADMYRLSAIEKKLGIVVYPKELYKGKVFAPFTPDTQGYT
ncbi:DEAD/DEAH box helicase [Breznakiellaceae bacterium SP9]